LRKQARRDVGRRARGETDDEADRPRRIGVFRAGAARERGQSRGAAGRQMQKSSTMKFLPALQSSPVPVDLRPGVGDVPDRFALIGEIEYP
jgi:hypothetical protein